MAKPYITLGFDQTFAGDSIQFYADGAYRTFTAIASAATELFEYRDNKFDATDISAIRFEQTINASLSSDYETIRAGNVLTIRATKSDDPNFDFGVVTILDGFGSIVGLFEQVASDGTIGTTLVDERLTSIAINSVTHNQVNFNPSLTRNFPFGNSKDLVETTINFTTFKTFGIADFKYGYIDNEEVAITENTQTGIREISDQKLLSYESGTIQSWIINESTGTATFRSPQNAANGSVTMTDLGGGDYEITHVHYLPIFTRQEDVTNQIYQQPAQFDGDKSLKYVFQITTREDNISTLLLESSSLGNASSFFKRGNLGSVGEFLNGGPLNYRLNSFEWNNAENSLNYTVNTEGVLQIKSNNGNFTATSEIELRIQEINDISNQSISLINNLKYEAVKVLADGTPVSGANLLNVTANVNGLDATLIDVTFNVLAYSYQDEYEIDCAVSNDLANINHNSFIVTLDSADAGVDTSDWILEAYPSSSIDTISLNPHYDMDISNALNNMVGMVEDIFLARFKFVDNSSDKTITKFTIALKSISTGAIFDQYQVTPTEINDSETGTLDIGKGYILATGDPRNSLKVSNVGNEYLFDFATQLWETQIDTDDLILSFTVLGNQTLDNGLIFDADKEWRTAILGYSINSNPTDYTDIANYDESRNVGDAPDPKYLLTQLVFTKEGTGETLSGISKTGNTKIEGIFSPNPLVINPIDENDLVGFLAIKPTGNGQFQRRQFTSYQSPESDSPFEDWDDSGFTTFCEVVLNLDDTISVRANLNSTKLALVYPDINKFDISVRLDKIQDFVEADKYIITSNTRNFCTKQIQFNSESLTGANVIAEMYDSLDTQFSYEIDSVPQADVSTFETNLASIVGTKQIDITNNDTGYIDSGLIVEHETVSANAQEIRYIFNQGSTPIDDIVVWFDREIQFTGLTIPSNSNVEGLYISIRTASPDIEDWANFDYNLVGLSLASINADIAVAAGIGKYAVHIKGTPLNNSLEELIMPFNFTDGTTFLDKINYDVNNVVDFNFGDGVTFENNGLGNCLIRYTGDSGLTDTFNWTNGNAFTSTIWINNNNSVNSPFFNLLFGNSEVGLRMRSLSSDTIDFTIGTNNSNRKGVVISTKLTNDRVQSITVTYDGSKLSSGFKAYVNGVEAKFIEVNTGSLNPSDVTIPTFYSQGQGTASFAAHVWKIRNWTIHNRVLTGHEIRRMHSEVNFVPISGLHRNYQMGTLSPSYPVNPEVVYETVNDLNFANLENHSNNRTPF